MDIRRLFLSSICATSLALSGGSALAQSATPDASPETTVAPVTVEPQKIRDADGKFVGYATLWEDAEGVHIMIKSGTAGLLAPGEHGVHLHETGVCEPEGETAFESAGGHFNPTDEVHGDANADPSHGGDLGNMTVAEDGTFEHYVVVSKVTLQPGVENSLNDADGTALVIHAGEDDLTTDPAGESGDREACGVIFAPIDSTATPAATPEN